MTDFRDEKTAATPEHVLRFWFSELRPEQWWRPDPQVDRMIRERFAELHEQLAESVSESWLSSPRSRLAAVIVLDQFSRNLYRGDGRAYANDADALALAQESIDAGEDQALSPDERAFLYMPFQHAEDGDTQARSVALFAALGDENYLDFARRHKAVIDRFGRFPHRNAELERTSLPEELEFLKKGKRF